MSVSEEKIFYIEEGNRFIPIKAVSEEEARAKYILREKSKVEDEIYKKFKWDFSLDIKDVILYEKIKGNCQKFSIPESDPYKKLKSELYGILLDGEDEKQRLSDKQIKILYSYGSVVEQFYDKYLYWLADQDDKEHTFRLADKIYILFKQLLCEERITSYQKGRVAYYCFLKDFCGYYCLLEGNNVIDYALYQLGINEVSRIVVHKDLLEHYLKENRSTVAPMILADIPKTKETEEQRAISSEPHFEVDEQEIDRLYEIFHDDTNFLLKKGAMMPKKEFLNCFKSGNFSALKEIASGKGSKLRFQYFIFSLRYLYPEIVSYSMEKFKIGNAEMKAKGYNTSWCTDIEGVIKKIRKDR